MDPSAVSDTRCRNLRLLFRFAGGRSRIAARLRINKTELNQLAESGAGSRINDSMARYIESRLGLQQGWLDLGHDFLPEEARHFAERWSMLPPGIRNQILDYINSEIEAMP